MVATPVARRVPAGRKPDSRRSPRPQLEADIAEMRGDEPDGDFALEMASGGLPVIFPCCVLVLAENPADAVRDELLPFRAARAEAAESIPQLIDRGDLELAMGLMGAVSQRRILEASQVIRRFLRQTAPDAKSEAQKTWGRLVLARALRLLLTATPGEVATEHPKMLEEIRRAGHRDLAAVYQSFLDRRRNRRGLHLERVKAFLREQALVFRDGGNLKEAYQTMVDAVGRARAERELGLSEQEARFNRVPEGD